MFDMVVIAVFFEIDTLVTWFEGLKYAGLYRVRVVLITNIPILW